MTFTLFLIVMLESSYHTVRASACIPSSTTYTGSTTTGTTTNNYYSETICIENEYTPPCDVEALNGDIEGVNLDIHIIILETSTDTTTRVY